MHRLLFAALAACLALAAAPADADRPNVVLVLIDDMGWKDLGCTGSTVHRTPNLDRLAADGVLFDQAYASAPNCAPTRACLMTGLWTPRHGVYTVEDSMGGRPESRRFIAPPNHTDLDPGFRTIAEMLRDAGYRTACVGKWNLGQGTNTPHSPTGQGFDEFRHYKRLGFRQGYFDGDRYSTDVLFDEAIDIARDGDRPFFIFLAPDAVHTPLAAPDATIAGYPDLDADRAIYAAMVEHVDRGVGRLMEALPPDTIVILTSDNGGDVSDNAPLRADKGAMYEGGIRVPLIVAGPGVREDVAEGRRSTTPCQSIDLVPTILDLCGVPVPGDLDGESLADELRGGAAIDRDRLFWHFPAYIGRNVPTSAMRQGDWKIIESLEDGSVELYDLASDPGETTNLADREPRRRESMRSALAAWQRETDAPGLLGPNPAFDPSATSRGGRGDRAGDRGGRDETRRRGNDDDRRNQGGRDRGNRGTPPMDDAREGGPEPDRARAREGARQGDREGDRQGGPGRGGARDRPARPTSVPVTVYADNWFELFINGRLVAVDPIEFIPHNLVRFEIVPEYPMTIAVQVRDFADPETGLEHDGTRIGDGGFIMVIGDTIVTDGKWRVRTIHHGPIDGDLQRPRVRRTEAPEGWTRPGFDDSDWTPATVFDAARVRPNAPGFDDADWHDASFIWDGDLDLDNTVLMRRTIESPPSASARPEGRPDARPADRTAGGDQPWLAAHAAELDADADGVLSRDELATDLATTMRGGDANRDGAIDTDEAGSLRGVRTASAGFLRGHFDELDADGDGRVTTPELAAGFGRMFDRMDADGDDRLTGDERGAATRSGGRPRGDRPFEDRGRNDRPRGNRGSGDRSRLDAGPDADARAGSIIEPPAANVGSEPPQAAAFRAFDDSVEVRWDEDWIYVESDGMPEHPMMVGITAWNRQVPIPHAYRGRNAFRLPRRPVEAASPIAVPYDGPVAVAVNGVPIFNPIKQNGRTDTAAAGELDRWGGHAGRGDDYHYHVLPTHLAESLPAGAPIAFALDGYPILGPTDLVGRRPTAPRGLDASHGHVHPHPHPDAGRSETRLDEPYHYHGSFDEPPYIQATFRGEVDLDARPLARGVRPFTAPLRGAVVTGFERLGDEHWRLEYTVDRRLGTIDYRRDGDGRWTFVLTDPDGGTRTETHVERNPRTSPPPRDDRRRPDAARPSRERDAAPDARPRRDRPRAEAERDRPRNVVLVVADDLGFADVGFHGGPVDTPHLDRLRAEGVELSRYYTMHTCGPTRAGIVTGCTSYRVGVTGNPEMLGPGVPLDFRLISEAFQDAGHRTAMLGKWHAGGAEGYRPTERGFDSFLGCLGGAIDSYTHQGGRPRTLDWWRDTTLSEETGYTTDLLADEAVRVIEAATAADEPFFIMLSYDAVHGPLRAPDELVAKYRGRGVTDARRATMLAMIEAMDTATGRVLDALDRTDTADDTVVVFVSDNGGQEPYGINAPWRGWKGDLLEGGVHGIGVVRLPDVIRPGSTSDQPMAMYDLFPTLAGLARIPTGVDDLDGVDLSTALSEGRVVPRPPIAVGGSDVAIIDGDWKLLRPRRGTESLYDLGRDPQETTDRLADEPAIAARLRAVAEALPRNQAFRKEGRGGGREAGGERRERPDRERPERSDRGDGRGGRANRSD